LLNVLVAPLVLDRNVTGVISGVRADDHQGWVSLHIEAIIMVDSAEWHRSSGYGKNAISRGAAVRRGTHARHASAVGTAVRRSGASSRRTEGDTSSHVDGLLKSLEDRLLAAGFDRARLAGVPALGILLSVGAAPCPL
jgi:hypothetical protein